MAQQAGLSVYRGDDLVITVTVTNPDGSNANLAGYTAQAQFRPTPNGALAASFACSIFGNVVTCTMANTVTAALSHTAYVWDFQLTSPTGWITTLLAGPVDVTLDVTH